MLLNYLNLSKPNNFNIGAEIHIDEYVPTAIPKNTNILKLLIASPPQIIKARFAIKVVSIVNVVRDKVSFMLKSIISSIDNLF